MVSRSQTVSHFLTHPLAKALLVVGLLRRSLHITPHPDTEGFDVFWDLMS